MFTIDILKEIIQDTAYESKTLNRIGITGSLSRNDFSETSDIDLVFDSPEHTLDEAILSAGEKIEYILINQFNLKLDIINYKTILNRKDKESLNYFREGYQKMYDDLIWLWERGGDKNELYQQG